MKTLDAAMVKTISRLRHRLGRCVESGHKQVALRRLREAKRLAANNPSYALDAIASAEYHLPYAEAMNERRPERRR